MRNSRHAAIVFILVIVATLGLRLFFAAIFRLPFAASAEAVPIDFLFGIHFWMISFLFALIMVLMLYSAVAFRRQPGDTEDGPHIHYHTGLEIGWTVIPTVIVLGFGVYGAVMLNDLIAPKPNEMVIKATGRQWSWSFEYPERESVRSAELYLSVGQPVVMEMEAEDVIHSFWVAEFRVKQDLVPGRTTLLRFTPTEIGEYEVRCAEICGTGHTDMQALVHVVDSSTFEQWAIDAQFRYSDLTPEERGERWWSTQEFGCQACHSSDGTPGVGPSWQGIIGRQEAFVDGSSVVVDDQYLETSIIDPNAQIVVGFQPGVMPQNYVERFVEKEQEVLDTEGEDLDIIQDIIAYMDTLE